MAETALLDQSCLVPPRRSRYHLSVRGLVAALQAAARKELSGKSQLRLLDVGCGDKPYRAFFAPYCDLHVGVDGYPGAQVDHVAPAERLPFDRESFDVVLCTQVLQHTDDPAQSVREIHRVLAPGGVCIVSTHGTFIYHPHPVDYWRWTSAGLEKLFRDAGFREVSVVGTEGIASSIGCLASYYLATFCERVGWLHWMSAWLVTPVSWVAPRIDRYLAWTFPDHPLPVNWLVVGRK
jgi:SAM-dependent methyltransferase